MIRRFFISGLPLGRIEFESHGRSPVRFQSTASDARFQRPFGERRIQTKTKERQIPASPRSSKTGSPGDAKRSYTGPGEKQSSYKQNLAVWRHEKPLRQFWHHGDRQQNSEGASGEETIEEGDQCAGRAGKNEGPIPDKPTTSPAWMIARRIRRNLPRLDSSQARVATTEISAMIAVSR